MNYVTYKFYNEIKIRKTYNYITADFIFVLNHNHV